MFMMVTSVRLLVFLSCIGIYLVASGPLHASCKINWKFGESCEDVGDAIISQMKKWSGPTGCDNGGEKCLYVLQEQTKTSIKATHETPAKHYIDSLTFNFVAGDNSCIVKAFSSSNTWFAVLDYGTNYCNLRNLIDGAQLDKVTGFAEDTSDDVCTQYSSRNCTRY